MPVNILTILFLFHRQKTTLFYTYGHVLTKLAIRILTNTFRIASMMVIATMTSPLLTFRTGFT